jgi:hypothetical protein
MMKKKVFFLITLLFLVSCATQKPHPLPTGLHTQNPSAENLVVWHLIDPLELELKLFNLDAKKSEVIDVKTALSKISLGPGLWQIEGFKLKGKHYKILNTSDKFVFRLKEKSVTYAGSIVIKCPRIGSGHNVELKSMSFFNRYHFKSKNGLCEMIVGNKFEAVKRAYQEIEKSPSSPLIQGF